MPEGPSIVILKEELQSFVGKKVLSVSGNTKVDLTPLLNAKIIDIKSWGKQLLICFNKFYLRIHLLMFGSYKINESKEMAVRLKIKVKGHEVNFYNCSVRLIEGDVNEDYDWEVDVMSDQWNAKKAFEYLKKKPEMKVCDALLDQQLFAGSGNIIKNEVLFRIRVHPDSKIGALPLKKLKELVKEVPNYSKDFYKWKKEYVFRAHWQIYKKKECPRCKIRSQHYYTGKTNRLTYCCANCQLLYS